MARRILLYSHDTVGLGHIRRILAIGRTLAAHHPEDTILILTASSIVESMHLPPNVDTLKLPAYRKIENGSYCPRRLKIASESLVRLRSDIIRQAFEHFDPHLFIVDKVPAGVHGELLATLERRRESASECQVILSLRDILDEPTEVIESWRRNGTQEVIRKHYDRVLVWGVPEVYDLVENYRLAPDIAAKVDYCGYISSSATDVEEVTAPHKKLVLATVGGGEDGYFLLDHFARSLPLTSGRFASVMLMGPDLPEDRKAKLRARIAQAGRPVFATEFTRHVERLLASAAVVVSMGGYNTICDVVSRGRRSIVVPRVTPRREQLLRAERFDALGHLRMIHPDELTPAGLASAIDEELAAPPRAPGNGMAFRGLDRAVEILDSTNHGAARQVSR